MINYGFGVQVNGNAIQAMNGITSGAHKMEHEATAAANKIQHEFKEVFSELKGMAMGFMGVFAGVEFLKSSFESFEKLEVVSAGLEANLKATHGTAGMTFEELEKGAKSLSKQVIYSRSDIMDMQSQLLTFPTITKPVFEESMKAVADIAAQKGKDLHQTSIMFGKAFSDPSRNINLLGRIGVTFSEQETQKVKQLQESGKLIEAQKFMLESINRSGYRGQAAAKAAAQPLAMAAKQMGDIKIEIGKAVSEILVKLLPSFRAFVDLLKEIFPHVKFAFNLLAEGISFAVERIRELWGYLKYVLGVFIAIKAVYLFDSLVTGAVSFIKQIDKISTGVTSVSKGLNSWTIKLLGAGASFLLINDIIEQIKHGGASAYAKELSKEDYKALSISSRREAGARAAQDKYPKGSVQYNAIQPMIDEEDEKEREISENINNLSKGTLLTTMFYRIGKQWSNNLKAFEDMFNKKEKHDEGTGNGIVDPNPLLENGYATSDLAGAKGGLGEAKVINIRMDDALKIVIPNGDSKDVLANADRTMDVVLRAINNVTHSQSGLM